MSADKETFLKGIDNLRVVGRDEQLNFKSSLKIFMFYIVLCCVSKYQETNGKVFFINGEAEKKRKDPTKGEYKRLFARRFSSDIKDLTNEWTVVSAIKKNKRFRLIIKALVDSPDKRYYMGRYLEYLLLCQMLECSRISEAASYGHYDEFTVWLTEVCANKSIKYTMFQHGIVLDKIIIPQKIHCSEMHVYNLYSRKVFESNIIYNASCSYVIDGLPQSVEFNEIKKVKGKYYVGIIDQNDDLWTERIISAIRSVEECVPIVMLHPLNHKEQDETIYTRNKYINLDIVIVNYSTLIMDYIAADYIGKIICTNKEATETIFGEYGFIYANDDEIADEIRRIEQV